MTNKFYVMVTQAREPEKVLCELSGQLWAESYSDAEIEMGKYREFLNEGHTGELDDWFYIVVAYREDQCRAHEEFECFKDNRVTKTHAEQSKHGQVGLRNDDRNLANSIGGLPIGISRAP